jgi:hypothetical protein
MAVEPEMLRDTYERVWAIRGPLQDEIRNNRAAAKKKPIPPPPIPKIGNPQPKAWANPIVEGSLNWHDRREIISAKNTGIPKSGTDKCIPPKFL